MLLESFVSRSKASDSKVGIVANFVYYGKTRMLQNDNSDHLVQVNKKKITNRDRMFPIRKLHSNLESHRDGRENGEAMEYSR